MAAQLRAAGFKGLILCDLVTGAVNVPLGMARRLKEMGIARVDEALQEASPEEYAALKKRERKEQAKAKLYASRKKRKV